MKLSIKPFFGLLFLISSVGFSQDFVIKNGINIQLMSNTDFYVNGLALNPSTDYLISADNNISRTTTPINGNSLNRVITIQNLINNYEGLITLFYEDSELNGVPENNLELQLKNESGIWTTYASTVDTANNSLSYNFTSPVSFLGVTGSSNAILSLNNSTLKDLKIYPNPTNSMIYLNSSSNLTTTLYNNIGIKIKQTNNNEINLKNLASGTYLLHISDNKTNHFITQKVIKY